MKRVISALYPRALASSITLPMDILRAASHAARAHGHENPDVEFMLAAPSEDPVDTVGGLRLTPDIGLDQLTPCDLLLLPAMWRNPRPVVRSQQQWRDVIPTLAKDGSLICAVGTASCFLAESGLLEGRAATTHWDYFDRFQADYPQVKLKRRHLITQSENLYCTGSVNSIADLLIHVVEEWYGPAIARHVENQFSPEIRRPFRAHAYQSPQDSSHHDEMVIDAQQWLQDNQHRSLSVSMLAQHLGCSTRTLSRRFSKATGSTPLQYLKSRRLAAARDLLRTSNLPVGDIAWRIGWQDVSYFTSEFQKYTGLTPARYRKSVRGKLFEPAR